MEDTDLMPYGKYKGYAMADVPAYYLIWLFENTKCSGDVKEYIKDNMQALRLEMKN